MRSSRVRIGARLIRESTVSAKAYPHFAFFRYADQPGMIGRVGTIFGEAGVNIASAAVGAEAGEEAVMAVTADKPVPQDLVERIVATDGFHEGHAVSL